MLADVSQAVTARLGSQSAAISALRPLYAWWLRTTCGRRGLDWHINGEAMRIDPAMRRMLPHENEPELFAFLRQHVRPGDVVIDIGAFLGTYAILEARAVGPLGRVVAFEPSPGTFDALERHLRMNGLTAPQVEARCVAVGERTGRVQLLTWKDEPYRNMVAPRGRMGVTIETMTLDDICASWTQPPTWIRMDVQGQEFAVLKGARELLRCAGRRLRIVAEMHPQQWPDYGLVPADAAGELASLGLRARALMPGRDPFAQGAHALIEPL
jgi:FkbM family methyltransferase